MSGQRVRKNVSPGGKQGPIRATVPLSLMQTCSPTRCLRSSPSNSPPVTLQTDGTKAKSRLSPENRLSPESAGYRGADRCGRGPVIRRTASVDTVYLLGQWQRDALHLSYCGRLMMDRATQTPDEFEEPVLRKKCPAAATGEIKLIRQRLQQRTSGRSQQQSPVQGDHSAAASPVQQPSSSLSSPRPIPTHTKHIPRLRSSLEGLNQEIERIVLREISNSEDDSEKALEPTPEGHRAPIADLFRNGTQSVDTQTPFERGDSSNSSGSSVSPVLPALDSSRPSSTEGSKDSPDTHKLATSPHINKFLAREPPDGCEKIKIAEESRSSTSIAEVPSKPSVNFVLLPSQRSAFDPLFKACSVLSTPNGELPPKRL